MNKQEILTRWLSENPGKTNRDWLLEVRCPNQQTKEAMTYLLDTLDQAGVKYGVCVKVVNYYTEYVAEPFKSITEAYFDVMIEGGNKNAYLIEADMPDEVLGRMMPVSKEEFPVEAYEWLVEQWLPEFTPESLSKEPIEDIIGMIRYKDENVHYLNHLIRGMGFLQNVNGSRGFVNWKNPAVVKKIVEKYKCQIAK